MCWGLCLRPALFIGLLCLSLCVGHNLVCVLSCWCPVVLRVSWPLAGVVCSFLCCFVRFCLCCLGFLRIGSFSPGSVPPCPAHPSGIWLYLATTRLWYGVFLPEVFALGVIRIVVVVVGGCCGLLLVVVGCCWLLVVVGPVVAAAAVVVVVVVCCLLLVV